MDRCKAASLRAARWNQEHPERRREIANRYARKPDAKRLQSAAAKRRRRGRRIAQARAGLVPVYRCRGCGAEWCPAPWTRGLAGRGAFCTDACRQRHHYRERVLGPKPRLPIVALPTIGSLFVPPPPRVIAPEAPPAPAELEPMGEEPYLPALGRPPTKSDAAVRLAQLRGEVDAQAVQYELEVGRDAANQLLTRLARAGRLVRVSMGVYAVPEATA